MFKIRDILANAFDRLLTVGVYIAAALVIAMMVIMNYEVVARYVFNAPTKWAVDVVGYLTLYAGFLAAALVLKEGGHIRVDIISGSLSVRGQAVLNCVLFCLGLAISAVLCRQSWVLGYDAYARGTEILKSMYVPRHIVYWPIVYGSAMLCIQCARLAWQNWSIARREHS